VAGVVLGEMMRLRPPYFLSRAAKAILPHGLVRAWEKRSGGGSHSFGGESMHNLFGAAATSGAVVNHQTALGVPAVGSCVGLLADMVGLLPLELYQKTAKGDLAAHHHAAHRVVAHTGDLHTSFELRQLVMTGVLLGGNGYVRVHRRGGVPAELEWLSPGKVSPERLPSTRFLTYRVEGERVPLDRTDIIHIRTQSRDGVRGVSPVTLLRESIGTSISQREAAGRLMSQSAQFQGVLEALPSLRPQQLEILKQEWRKFHEGVENAGRTPIISGASFKPVGGMSAADAQFLESRRFELQEIARAYRIPPFLIGDTTANTSWGSGIEQQNLGFMTYTLNPWLINWEQALNYTLLTRAEQDAGYHFKFDREELGAVSLAAQAAFISSMRNAGVFSPNDSRAWLGYPCSEAEGMDNYQAPLNSAASGKAGADLAAATNQGE